ncbi:MAG: DHH family phosphoesterase [Acholeplasmatales bacterium]|nr:DHH family phosphoesterase [Acholeplasmatales bacterium]
MNTIEQIKNYIINSQRIIIQTHNNPDGDASGSSYGLTLALKNNFPEKEIYCLGNTTNLSLDAKFDVIADDLFSEALVIITDVLVDTLLNDHRYEKARLVVGIDHHTNDPALLKCDAFLRDANFSSACSLVTMLLLNWEFSISSEAATYLLLGVITDSGRFLYLNENNARLTLISATSLIESGANIKKVYDSIYVEPLEKKVLKNKFLDFKVSSKKVAYRFNKLVDWQKLTDNFFFVSRETVNFMAGIKEVPIWANFTQALDGSVACEIRSRDIVVVDIAKAHGGGGHNFACGCKLKDFNEAKLVIKELGELINE